MGPFMSADRGALVLSTTLCLGAVMLVGERVVRADGESGNTRLDSDADGIADADEDGNRNGQLDHGETSLEAATRLILEL